MYRLYSAPPASGPSRLQAEFKQPRAYAYVHDLFFRRQKATHGATSITTAEAIAIAAQANALRPQKKCKTEGPMVLAISLHRCPQPESRLLSTLNPGMDIIVTEVFWWGWGGRMGGPVRGPRQRNDDYEAPLSLSWEGANFAAEAAEFFS